MRTMRSRWLPILIALLSTPGAGQTSSSAPAPVAPAPATARRAVGNVPAYPIAGGKGTASILFDAASGSPEAALTLLVFQPGAVIPEHVHETVELVYVLEGAAEVTLAGEVLETSAGTAVRIPANVKHAARVVGEKPFRALQIYAPAGPEQRFVPRKK